MANWSTTRNYNANEEDTSAIILHTQLLAIYLLYQTFVFFVACELFKTQMLVRITRDGVEGLLKHRTYNAVIVPTCNMNKIKFKNAHKRFGSIRIHFFSVVFVYFK